MTTETRPRTLGEELAAWRAREGIRPAEAARRCKMSPQYYAMVEAGDRTDLKASFLIQISEATGLPLDVVTRAAAVIL